MSSKVPKSTKQQPFIEVTESTTKDLLLVVATFFCIIIILIHYAWLMRQWVLNPELSRGTLTRYVCYLLITVLITVSSLIFVIYPRIYGTKKIAEATGKKEQ